ncbi:MAG: hypothetical protein FJX36_12605 [Alphaproteobacteria bacterium]|nr:hypothetical protein [Alphaproteobacteria bacterium]
MARLDIRKGQRFCNADASFIVWLVDGLMEDSAGVPHARLHRVNDPNTIKTLSIAALRDGRLYRPVGTPLGDDQDR